MGTSGAHVGPLRIDSVPRRGGGALEILTVPHSPTSAGEVRRGLVESLNRRGLPGAVIDDAVLLVSELVGNAVRYASPLPGNLIEVSWTFDRDSLRLRVTDGGSRYEPRLCAAGPRDTRGRGLAIVNALAQNWGVDSDPRGSSVWAELAIMAQVAS